MTTVPYLTEQLTADAAQKAAGDTFLAAIDQGVLWSLGARDLHTVAGIHQLGGLFFLASILPMVKNGRGSRARKMAVMVSLTGADTIDINVREVTSGRDHAHIEGVYIDQLSRALLSLDYDGNTVTNPRYWN